MPVYNEIDFDGRVLRCAECLSERYHVTTFSVDSHNGYSHPKFNARTVDLSLFSNRRGLRYIYYCIVLITILSTKK